MLIKASINQGPTGSLQVLSHLILTKVPRGRQLLSYSHLTDQDTRVFPKVIRLISGETWTPTRISLTQKLIN